MKFKAIITGILLCAFALPVAESADKVIEQFNILLVIDGSSYSNAKWDGKTKLLHMREAISNSLAELNKSPSWGLNMGLRIFGDQSPRSKNDCSDFRVGAQLDWFEPVLINSVLEGVKPKGMNCLSAVLESSKSDFASSGKQAHNYVVAIVSARDECTKDEKASLASLVQESSLEGVFIVGVSLSKVDQEFMQTLFETAPGAFFNATTSADLNQHILQILTIHCQGKSESSQNENVSEQSKSEHPGPDSKSL